MSKFTTILVSFITFCAHSQNFGFNKLSNSLFECDEQPTLIKSTFNNCKLTFKKDGKDYLSPSYSNSYLYFRDNLIGVLVAPSEITDGKFLLSGAKVLNDKEKEKKLVFYTKENHLLTVDYDHNTITWSYSTDNLDYLWTFENLSLGNENEISDFIEMFSLENIPLSELSQNSQNLIGLTENQVLLKYSKHFEKPKLIVQRIGNFTDENDLILLFNSVEEKDLFNIAIFDMHQICKYILSYYPNDFLESLSNTYREAFGEPTEGLTWYERVGEKKYSYTIDLISARDTNQFVVHTKRTE